MLGVSLRANLDCTFHPRTFYKDGFLFCSSLKIVDDDIDWKQMVKEEEQVEEDDEEAPVVSQASVDLKNVLDVLCSSLLGSSCVVNCEVLQQWKHIHFAILG